MSIFASVRLVVIRAGGRFRLSTVTRYLSRRLELVWMGEIFFTAAPCDSFSLKCNLFYCYFGGSLLYDLNEFFLAKMTDTLYDSGSRWRACIPVFNSKEEKDCFVKYLETIELNSVTNYNVFVPYTLPNGGTGKEL